MNDYMTADEQLPATLDEASTHDRQHNWRLPTQIVVSSRSLLSVHPNRDNRQRRITAIRSPPNLYDDLIRIRGSNRDLLRQFNTFPRLLGRTTVQRRVRAMLVVPGSVTIKPTLQRTRADGHNGDSQPDSEGSEQPLDLAVERRLANLALDDGDSAMPEFRLERVHELTAMVGDDESKVPKRLDCGPNDTEHICRRRCCCVNLQLKQLARESIDQRGNVQSEPEDAQLHHVDLPNTIGRLRREQMIGFGALRRHDSRPDRTSLGPFFTEDTLDRRPADLHGGSDDMPSDRSRANFGLRAQPPQFMNRPADCVMQTIPHGTGEEVARTLGRTQLLQPAADGVGMQGKSPGRLGCGPRPKPHDLKDLKSMRRCIMRPLFRREPLALLAEDGQFPLEQPSVPRGRISGRRETNHGRGMRSQTRPREHVTLGDGYGDRVNQMEDRRIGPGRHDLSLPSGLDDHANRSIDAAAKMTLTESITGM